MQTNYYGRLKNITKRLLNTGFFHIFSSSVANKIITFASGIILVRILSKSEYGIYTYANTILAFCSLASGLGMSSAVLQMCSEKRDSKEKDNIYQFGCQFGIKIDLLLAIIIVLIALLIPLPIKGANGILVIMCFIPLFQFANSMQITRLRYEMRNKEYSASNLFGTIVLFIFACILSYLFRAKGLVAAHYATTLLLCSFILFKYKISIPLLKGTIDKGIKTDLLKIGCISMINNGLTMLMYYLDIFIIGLELTDESVVASYKIATTIPTALAFIPSAIIIYIYPYFAKHNKEKKWVLDKYKRLSVLFGTANLVLVALSFILAPLIIRMIFGKQYLDAVPCFRILICSYFITGTFRDIAGNLLVTQRKLKFNMLVAIVSGLSNLIMNVVFINNWGAVGAAWATLITALIAATMNVVYLLYTFNRIDDRNESKKNINEEDCL